MITSIYKSKGQQEQAFHASLNLDKFPPKEEYWGPSCLKQEGVQYYFIDLDFFLL